MSSYNIIYPLALFLAFLVVLEVPCQARELSTTFYDRTCPKAQGTIRTVIRRAVSRERRMAASLIRLHFHDCFVQGCDASILLEDTANFTGEQRAPPNNNSVRGYEVIEAAKRDVEALCPGVVSCADIVAVAARDASVAVGGPSWGVKLGRRDSTNASRAQAAADLPRFTDPLGVLISNFKKLGLSERDLVALSGAHTLGQAQCFTFRQRIYNGTNIDAGFTSTRRRRCRATGGNSRLAPLDLVTPNTFDNNYYLNLLQRRGLLESDQVLFSGGSTDGIVREYSDNPATFAADFAAAMVRMGDIQPLTGRKGQIRRICGAVN